METTTETTKRRTPRATPELCGCGKPKGHNGRPSAACKANGQPAKAVAAEARPPIAGGSNGHDDDGREEGNGHVAVADAEIPLPTEVGTSQLFDSELLAKVCLKVQGDGFVPRQDLEKEFGPDKTSQALAILYRTHRVLTEVRRKWTDGNEIIGYVWATEGLTNKKMKKLPEYLGFLKDLVAPGGPRYKDYEAVTVTCQWTNWVLAGLPRGKEQEERLFERDADNSVVIPAYCVRAMFAKALPMIGAEVALSQRIHIAAVRVKDPKIQRLKMPVVDMTAAPGHRGKGINEHEALAPGTKFELECIIPTSVIDPEDFLRMTAFAGKYVRLSPARSSGYGDFVVVTK